MQINRIITIQQTDNLIMLKRTLSLSKIPLNQFGYIMILRHLSDALQFGHLDVYQYIFTNCNPYIRQKINSSKYEVEDLFQYELTAGSYSRERSNDLISLMTKVQMNGWVDLAYCYN